MATSRLIPDMMFAGSLLGAAGYYLWMQESTVVEANKGEEAEADAVRRALHGLRERRRPWS